MRKTPICFKQQYGTSVYYCLMLQIKKDYPDKKKYRQLFIFFPFYLTIKRVLDAEFVRLYLETHNLIDFFKDKEISDYVLLNSKSPAK